MEHSNLNVGWMDGWDGTAGISLTSLTSRSPDGDKNITFEIANNNLMELLFLYIAE